MNIVKATKKFEDWLGLHIRIVEPDLRFKHQQMAASLFPFFRATFYRWVQVWPEVCEELNRAPRLLSVGDLHVENFGTWRDSDGRLVWGVNDFDEACLFPYTMDLVRLATSALLATREERLAMKPKESAAAILAGYEHGLEDGGRPFVLGENHEWLRAIAESKTLSAFIVPGAALNQGHLSSPGSIESSRIFIATNFDAVRDVIKRRFRKIMSSKNTVAAAPSQSSQSRNTSKVNSANPCRRHSLTWRPNSDRSCCSPTLKGTATKRSRRSSAAPSERCARAFTALVDSCVAFSIII